MSDCNCTRDGDWLAGGGGGGSDLRDEATQARESWAGTLTGLIHIDR